MVVQQNDFFSMHYSMVLYKVKNETLQFHNYVFIIFTIIYAND